MAIYRYQVVSVGMWRGKIKRWNTTFHMANSTSTAFLYNRMQHSGWKNPGDVLGACSGGTASITVYDAAGGAPLLKTVYFDWQVPSEWIPYTSEDWAGVDPLTGLDAAGESALVLVGHLPGLSATGKPMTTRKYLHAVPSRTSTDYLEPDVSAAVQSAFLTDWSREFLLSPSGIQPVSAEVLPYYGSHQRVRGRRRPVAQVAANAFSFGVLAGGGATTSGQGEPFPGGEF